MSFIENIKNCIAQADSDLIAGFRLTSFGFRSAYLENVRCVISYDKEQIVLGLKKGGLKLSGRGLYIKKYCAGDVVVCGEILKIERV